MWHSGVTLSQLSILILYKVVLVLSQDIRTCDRFLFLVLDPFSFCCSYHPHLGLPISQSIPACSSHHFATFVSWQYDDTSVIHGPTGYPALLIFHILCGFFLTCHCITCVCQPPPIYSPAFAPRDFWLYPKLKSPLKHYGENNSDYESGLCRLV